VIREALSAVARNESLGPIVGRTPVARNLVKHLIGGESLEDALALVAGLTDRGYLVSLERAAPHVVTDEEADTHMEECVRMAAGMDDAGLSGVCELAVFPEALLAVDGQADGWDRLLRVVEAAAERRVCVMLGAGPDPTLSVRLREDLAERGFDVGATVAAAHRGSEADCRRLADHRVRLVKGGRRGDSDDLQHPIEIDKAYVRCAKALLKGAGDPSFATHDPRLVDAVQTLAPRYERAPHSYEFAFFLGRQEAAQERLLAEGERVRIYVPYGPHWFERLVGGLAEQSGTIGAALRSLLPR
jgi:proline dehydrogenase